MRGDSAFMFKIFQHGITESWPERFYGARFKVVHDVHRKF